jgi:response regulator of citrate/malate metabolism
MTSPPTLGPFRVLVVDDDFMVARIHTRYLEGVDGFEVVDTVHTGNAALEVLAATPVDLMLLDIYLPDMTGIDLLRRVRAEFPGVDVLIVTAARELETVREAMLGGAVSYLIKPFDYSSLGERLAHFRRTRSVLGTADQVEQHQVDQLFGVTGAKAAAAELPKGLSRESADAVRSLLTREEAISATECAERVGLSRVSARRYLEFLEQSGAAEVSLKYGTGRPERRYRLR